MLSRRVTRVINSVSGTEITQSLQDPNSNAEVVALTASDFLYVGFYGKFLSRHFDVSTVNSVSGSFTVEYFGADDAWHAAEDVVDQTQYFTKSGFISWRLQDEFDWKETTVAPVSDVKLFWVRISVSADLTPGTALQSILNLYSDDDALRIYYPELITDTRFLPDGRSSFIDQHRAAKDLVVLRLQQRRAIFNEDMVIDINPYVPASVHAAAEIILAPIDPNNQVIDRAKAAFANEIDELARNIDLNRDGRLSQAETDNLAFTSVVRR